MLPLPMPIRGGSLEALTSFFNLPTRNDFLLVVAWLLTALRHGGPYPLLAISGEQGSAKTVLSKILRALIDPCAARDSTGTAAAHGRLCSLGDRLRTRFLSRARGFLYAYKANRRSALQDVVEADPVAARIRDLMAARPSWSGNASELLRVVGYPRDEAPWTGVGWPKSPRALAGRLRRAQTPLRALGIEMSFAREGRAGTRIIRLRASRPQRQNRPR